MSSATGTLWRRAKIDVPPFVFVSGQPIQALATCLSRLARKHVNCSARLIGTRRISFIVRPELSRDLKTIKNLDAESIRFCIFLRQLADERDHPGAGDFSADHAHVKMNVDRLLFRKSIRDAVVGEPLVRIRSTSVALGIIYWRCSLLPHVCKVLRPTCEPSR